MPALPVHRAKSLTTPRNSTQHSRVTVTAQQIRIRTGRVIGASFSGAMAAAGAAFNLSGLPGGAVAAHMTPVLPQAAKGVDGTPAACAGIQQVTGSKEWPLRIRSTPLSFTKERVDLTNCKLNLHVHPPFVELSNLRWRL